MVAAETNGRAELPLFGFLRERARTATEQRLAFDIAVGSVACIIALAVRPEWWGLLAGAGVVLLCFGTWALTARLLNRAGTNTGVTLSLKAAHAISAWLGFAAALGTGFLLWTMLMGTWIS